MKPIFTFYVQAGDSCKWTDDSQRLILENFDAICDSPSHTYNYALPFSPSSSWLHKSYSAELLQAVKVVKGIPARWGACSRTVSLSHLPKTLVGWKDMAAVGLSSGDIIILNATTGTNLSVLSGHTDEVNSLDFSLDGALLVSGSNDKTVKLWDIQTGGVIKTFHGHTNWVQSVSISPDCTTIASGSKDKKICLWDPQTGECCRVIEGHKSHITFVGFSPTNSKLLTSASGGAIHHWDMNGCQIGSMCPGNAVAFSSDGFQFISWRGEFATIRSSDSRETMAKLHMAKSFFRCCCFSPNGRFIAAAVGELVHVWDITGPDPCLVGTLTGHNGNITSLTFSSSSLISSSQNKSVKFWQISALSTDLVAKDLKSTPTTSVSIQSIGLQAKDGIAISSDSDGMVRTWDISTGQCKASFQTPAKGRVRRDVQMIDGNIILVWFGDKKIHIWDAKQGEPLHEVDIPSNHGFRDLRISGDGSKVFFVDDDSLQSWSIQTGDATGEVKLEGNLSSYPPTMDGSRIWVYFQDSPAQVWDFGIQGSPPVKLPDMSPDRPHLDLVDDTKRQNASLSRIKDTETGKEVFQLCGKYSSPAMTQWDGQYLVAGYRSGEVLILDFIHMIPT